MHRLIALAGTVCVVLLISTGAFAQVLLKEISVLMIYCSE
jgi:hypothetical protein